MAAPYTHERQGLVKYEQRLNRGRLVRRYKRFLADVELEDGSIITIHCPNTGSMKNCAVPGDEVWFSTSLNTDRKYPQTWELVRTGRGHYIGINTTRANRLTRTAIQDGAIEELSGYASLQSEVKYGVEKSRIDFLLQEHTALPDCYVEVKSVTLLEAPVSKGVGYFPDAVSTRGAKHLRELIHVAADGYRAMLFYCVQHSGIQVVRPARHIDNHYFETLVEAINCGVEVIAYKARMSPFASRLWRRIPIQIEEA
ncbi:MAG: DNA/RNA nuclease SfsA [Pseudomonadales bacterium]